MLEDVGGLEDGFFFHLFGIVTPSDELHHFSEGVAGEKPPTSWKMMEEIFNERENNPLPSGNLT